MDFKTALAKLQSDELEILKAIDAFCKEHGIEWFIDSGTVLGAVRHGGFIPWDDDIDIGMLRKDYDRFIDLAQACFPRGFSVHTCANTSGYAGMFAKVYLDGTLFETAETQEAGLSQGIFVDVFPYDFLSSDAERSKKQRSGARFWQSISYLYHSGSIVVPHKGALGVIEKAACKIVHPLIHCLFSPKLIADRFSAAIQCDGGDASKDVLPFAWPNVEGLPVDVLVPAEPLAFEGIEFPGPCNAIRYREIMYGDWSTLPAPEDRRTHLPQLLRFSDGSMWEEDRVSVF